MTKKIFLIFPILFLALSALMGQSSNENQSPQKESVSYFGRFDIPPFELGGVCINLPPISADVQEMTLDPVILPFNNQLPANSKIDNLDLVNTFHLFLSTEDQTLKICKDFHPDSAIILLNTSHSFKHFSCTLQGIGQTMLDYSYKRMVQDHEVETIIHLPIIITPLYSNLQGIQKNPTNTKIIQKDSVTTCTNLEAGNLGIIDIEIPSIAKDENEITISSISLHLSPSGSLAMTQALFRVHHTINHPWGAELLCFKPENIEAINSSLISAYPWETSYTYPSCDGTPSISFNNYLMIPKTAGTTTVDFSYTKTIPAHYQSHWSWTWIPEQKITTKVHVPVEILSP